MSIPNKILAISIIIIAILTGPFAFYYAKNEVKLYFFSKKLDYIDGIKEFYGKEIARGKRIIHSGNSEYCTYTATRVYLYFAGNEHIYQLKESIEKFQINDSDVLFSEKIEKKVIYSNSLLIVSIKSGPYSAGLDVRCW